jgi:hypothetical protein
MFAALRVPILYYKEHFFEQTYNGYTVIRFVSIIAKFGICTVVLKKNNLNKLLKLLANVYVGLKFLSVGFTRKTVKD